jgi:WD40 repeat protein
MTVKLWDKNNGDLLRTLIGHVNSVLSVEFASNNILASGSWDTTIRLWDTNSGSLLRTLEGHGNRVNQVAFDSDYFLASGSADKTVKLWGIYFIGQFIN